MGLVPHEGEGSASRRHGLRSSWPGTGTDVKIRLLSPLLSLILVASTVTPVAAQGTVNYSRTDQIFQCSRVGATGIHISFKPALIFNDPPNYALVAFNLYGEAGFGMVARGWQGWQSFAGSPWFYAYTNGYPQYWSLGSRAWVSDLTVVGAGDNFNSFGNQWWIYTLVQWPDGHQTGHWQMATAC
jgi:hypothetical protein